MKMCKTISINPKIVLTINELVEIGEIPSFSWFAENTMVNALKEYQIPK